MNSNLVVLSIMTVCVLGCATQKVAPPELPHDQGFKALTFAAFAGDFDKSLQLPLEIVIPTIYERAQLPPTVPDDYSYWMPHEKMKAALESGDLPADTGYFYSKISLNVGYDAEKKLFVGIEDRDSAAEMKAAGIENFTWERADLHGYPAIFCRFKSAGTKQVLYSVYIAALSESLVFYVSYTPPLGDPAGGEKTWSRFRSALIGAAGG
jgi:hypothetical protein